MVGGYQDLLQQLKAFALVGRRDDEWRPCAAEQGMQMGSWEGNEICKHTHPHTHMSTLCVAERDLGFAFFGAWSLPGRSPFSSPTATLPAISKYSSTLRSLAHTTTHENKIAHQSRPRAKLPVCEWMWGPLWPDRPSCSIPVTVLFVFLTNVSLWSQLG
jgi:hypothetical protein